MTSPNGVHPTSTTTAPPAAASWGGLTGDDGRTFIFWGLGAGALVLLAGYWPRVALALTGLLAAGVALNFAGQITGWLQSATPQSVTGGAAQAGSAAAGIAFGQQARTGPQTVSPNASGTGGNLPPAAVRFPSAGVRSFIITRQSGER